MSSSSRQTNMHSKLITDVNWNKPICNSTPTSYCDLLSHTRLSTCACRHSCYCAPRDLLNQWRAYKIFADGSLLYVPALSIPPALPNYTYESRFSLTCEEYSANPWDVDHIFELCLKTEEVETWLQEVANIEEGEMVTMVLRAAGCWDDMDGDSVFVAMHVFAPVKEEGTCGPKDEAGCDEGMDETA